MNFFRKRLLSVNIVCFLLLSSCNQAAENDNSKLTSSSPSIELDEISKQVNLPNFDESEEGVYYYSVAVSETDKKDGKSAPDVVAFRYLGKNEKGEHIIGTIQMTTGQVIFKDYCKDPCKIIRGKDGKRIGYNPESIIGAAFQDAIAGHLKVSSSSEVKTAEVTPATTYPKFVSSVPEIFFGNWDELIADECKEREARFFFEARRFKNFEVDWEVSKVKLYSPTEMDMTTTTYDNEMNQVDAIWEFKLVDGGKTLTGRKPGEFFFKRCP